MNLINKIYENKFIKKNIIKFVSVHEQKQIKKERNQVLLDISYLKTKENTLINEQKQLKKDKSRLISNIEYLKVQEDSLSKLVNMAELKEKSKIEDLKDSFSHCNISDYASWLKGFIENGGEPTHRYDYPWERWDWKKALNDTEIFPLYGANSFNLIVGKNVEITGDPGHTLLFFLKDYTCSSTIPEFTNIHASEFI